MSNRLNDEREQKLQPLRMEVAVKEIESLGYVITYKGDVELWFIFKGNTIRFFPYSGWHSGKGIKDGRGLRNLLNQIKP
jgi:hypothetical protein